MPEFRIIVQSCASRRYVAAFTDPVRRRPDRRQ